MGELARGNISDRPWGLTLGALGLRGLTGQLEVFSEGKVYAVAFQHGTVVAAHSPVASDAAVRLALTGNLITSTQVADITRRMAAQPDRDEVELLAEIARLQPEHAQRLRRRLVAQRAARTFSAERGEFVVKDTTTLAIVAGTALDIRTVVYLGAKSNLSEQRLASELGQLGAWFQIKPDTLPDLAQYGFTDAEKPILRVLIEGANVSEIEVLYPDLGVRAIHAVTYALASCGACDRSLTPRPPRAQRPSGAPTHRQPNQPTRSGPTSSPVQARVPTPTAAPSVIRMPATPTTPPPSQDSGPVRVSRTSTPPPGAPIDQMVPRSGTTSPPATRTPTPTSMPRMPSNPGGHPPASFRPTPSGVPRMPSDQGEYPPTIRETGHPPTPSGLPRASAEPAVARTQTPAATSRTQTDPAMSRVPTPASTSRTQTDPSVGRTPSPPLGRTPSPQQPVVGRSPTGPSESRTPTSPSVSRVATGPQVSRTGTGPQVSRTMSPSAGIPSAMNPAGTGSHRSVEGTTPPATRAVPSSMKRARRDSAALAEIEDLLHEKVPMLDRGVDHFGLLGLPQDASPADVRSAYFSLARKLHPDRLAAIGVFDEERRAQRLMAQVNLAFAVLNDPAKRDEYMKILRRGGEAAVKAEDAKADELAMSVMRAEEAFKQGEMALRRDQIQQAIEAFALAVELQPREAEYQAMLAWAQFAGATDKNAIAASVRKTLLRAAEDNDRSVTAKFYLGRIERMLGREKEALAHFQEVLRIKPNHTEATSEARLLEQRLRNKR